VNYAIRALSLSGILDQAITLLRNHIKLLLTVAAFVYIPFGLLQEFIPHFVFPGMAAAQTMEEYSQWMQSNLGPYVALSLAFVVVAMVFVWPLTNAAIIYAVSREYLGKPVSAREALRHAFSVFLPLVGTNFLATLLIFLGALLCLVPGIYLAFRYWFVSYAVIIERVTGSAALKRSGFLMKENMGTAFVLGLLIGILSFAVSSISGFVPFWPVQAAVTVLLEVVVMMIGAVAGVVFYYSARCQKEHFDLGLLARAMMTETEPGYAQPGEPGQANPWQHKAPPPPDSLNPYDDQRSESPWRQQ
jgi:hypothetical protein